MTAISISYGLLQGREISQTIFAQCALFIVENVFS